MTENRIQWSTNGLRYAGTGRRQLFHQILLCWTIMIEDPYEYWAAHWSIDWFNQLFARVTTTSIFTLPFDRRHHDHSLSIPHVIIPDHRHHNVQLSRVSVSTTYYLLHTTYLPNSYQFLPTYLLYDPCPFVLPCVRLPMYPDRELWLFYNFPFPI